MWLGWEVWRFYCGAAICYVDCARSGMTLFGMFYSWKGSKHGWEVRAPDGRWRNGITVRIWRGGEAETVNLQQPIVIRREQ